MRRPAPWWPRPSPSSRWTSSSSCSCSEAPETRHDPSFLHRPSEDRAVTQRRSYAVGTGLFIVLGFAALAYLATQTTSVANTTRSATYTVDTRFANIGQLKARAPVKIAGVRVGSVQAIDLVPGKEEAKVTLAIDDRHQDIPADSVATIYTSGLLGDQYVGIQFGRSKTPVKEGGEIGLTRPAQQLEEMLGKFFGGGSAPDRLGGTFHVTGNFTNV